MKKDIARKPVQGNLSSDSSLLFLNKESIEKELVAKIQESDEISGTSLKAKYDRDEWVLRFNVSTQLSENDPDNENLSFLKEQAKINLHLATKRVDALVQQEILAIETKKAALESLKKLQRLEILRASGNAVRGNRDELLEIMTRTAALELSDNSSDRDTRRAEYYAQALLEISMEGK